MTIRTKQNLLDLYPLTPLQQGILFHSLASELADPYLVRVCFRLDGAVDASALHAAWQTVVDRHEALRADLEWVKSKQPIELVFRTCPVTLVQLAWDDVPADEVDAKLRALVDDEAAQFSLQRAADQRVVFVRTAADRGFLLWVFHHALLDGWSVANVLAEVLTSYRATISGVPAALETVPPYASYLTWLRGQDAAAAEAYWRTALAGYEAAEFPPPAPNGSSRSDQRATDARPAAPTPADDEVRASDASHLSRDAELATATTGAAPGDAVRPSEMSRPGRDAELAIANTYSEPGDEVRASDASHFGRDAELATATTGAAPGDASPGGYAERSIVFDEQEAAQLRALASQAHVTLSTCFQGAVALLLKAYTGRDDVVFGATAAGRPAELTGSAAMVGTFINTVPVRVRLGGGDTVVPWLLRLHHEAGQRHAFEHLGLPRIQELAALPAGTSLFEAILVFESFPVAAVLEQVDALPFAVEQHRVFGEDAGLVVGRGRNNYPVTFVVLPGRRIELILAYHRDRIGDALASAMLARLAQIVRALPAAGASRLAILDGCSRADGSGPSAAPPSPRAIHDRIGHWAVATAAAIAVRCEDHTLTYAELAARAHALAHQLRDRGVTEGDRVGICLPRSADFVVALCAALQCGAAYVPIDPDQPRARLAGLVDDAQITALVTRRAQLAALDGVAAALVPCDHVASAAARPPIHVAVHPESPAYLIYTSGSTGRPKGVVVSHRALDNYVTGVTERMALPPGASMAMVSTVAADLGHTALFGALCSGGTLHLITDERAADPDGFADYMARHQVAALKIVPGHLWGLMQTPDPDRALPSHTLVIGGEAAPRPLLERLRRQTRCRVINHYGPTETTVGILTHELARGAAASDATAGDGAAVPLGRPLPHTRAYVLGSELRPTPVGAIGEIYLGGRGLAAGYFRRPELTADRFIPDPRSGEPGARLYRTGDRGRLRPDGAIDFLGRADDQIKLRGFRIEPGEIRAELMRAPGIADARIVVRPGPAGTPQLCAYLVGAPDPSAPVDAHLRTRLPDPMIPAVYVWLDRFPVTANGKVDLARLPAPGAGAGTPDAVSSAADRAPATDPERTLAAIWQDILGCPRVQRDDNFFQLGGDSILALKVVARARRAGLKITPKQLHAHPTLADAARVAQPIVAAPATAAPTTSSPPAGAAPVQPVPGEPRLTPIQQRFLDRQTIDPHHYNQAILLALSEPIARDVLERALDQLTQRHDALRLRFRRDGEHWRAWYADAGATGIDARALPPVAYLDLRTAADPAEAIDRACDELQRGFDLAQGPLLRAAYLDLGPDREPRLLLFAHHLVVDGVSWRILLEDLAELVAGGGAADLPPATTPFHDFAERLYHHGRAAALRDELGYWQRVVATHHEHRGDDDRRPRRGANTVGDAAILSAELDERTTAALLAKAPRAYATVVNELLLAALAPVLCRSWRRTSVLVTMEGHGREDLFDGVDLSRTVGWFSTLYPVRLTPAAGGDRAATIRTIRDHLRQVPANGIGYGLLRSLAPSAALATAADEPRVTFNYLGQFDQAFAGQQLFRVAPEASGRRRSPHTPRDGWFVVNAVVYDGALRVDWEYSRTLHDRGEVEQLVTDYLAELRALVAHCEAVLGDPP